MTIVKNLSTFSERKAEMSESLSVFSGLKISYIKEKVTEILGLIGRDGIFDEYTRHDISHINTMLESLDWIIPENTKEIMTAADWLLTVLAIYFHDMGMLVTRNEFEKRYQTGYKTFKSEFLIDENNMDFITKLNLLKEEKQERFLYQEFVRQNHAIRIKNWIEGNLDTTYGISEDIVSEISDLLRPLGEEFKRDLALVCESHHLDDLTDFDKYPVSKPYGNRSDTTANVQYVAVLLRTADLLHITENRTPSISFKLISPTDPISQEEWAKQAAVRNVRAEKARDKNGNVDDTIQSDTIEVHATFKEKSGFFGLTSYLNYAEHQMEKSFKAVKIANDTLVTKHTFPWRNINQDNIKTNGFLSQPFNFTLDIKKILELLTGHTLYNDSNVVIRELIQNSLDAVRLQSCIDNSFEGEVLVKWNSTENTLIVQDNGTGMTQEIIENFFLKAGVSRYQDEKFKKDYPNFSSISRFGIGILSMFMIADDINVITTNIEEEKARKISLRTVHGKYLIELLEKSKPEVREIGLHGTSIKLKVRPNVVIDNILDTVKRWIVFPKCKVTVQIDGKNHAIGYESPKQALELLLNESGYELVNMETNATQVEVREKEINGVTIAYAVKWSNYFNEWTFLTVANEDSNTWDINLKKNQYLGMCIEGIRVDFNTPGFKRNTVVAIGNVEGSKGPKTNVAREGIENTKEYEEMLISIYRIFYMHIKDEMEGLKNKYSLTWVTQESNYLLEPLLQAIDNDLAVNEKLILEEMNEVPTLIAEIDNKRVNLSINELKEKKEFCTIQSNFYSIVESLMRELHQNISVSEVVESLGVTAFNMPNKILLSRVQNRFFDELLEESIVKEVSVNKQFKRVDIFWCIENTVKNYLLYPNTKSQKRLFLHNRRVFYNDIKKICIIEESVKISGLEDEIGFVQGGTIYLIGNSGIGKYCNSLLLEYKQDYKEVHVMVLINIIIDVLSGGSQQADRIQIVLDRNLRDISIEVKREMEEKGITNDIKQILMNECIKIYDPVKWIRNFTM